MAIAILFGSGCESPTLSSEDSELAPADAARVAIYQELAQLKAWEHANAYCLSEGEGSNLQDPSQVILNQLAADTARFVPLSTCVLDDGWVRESDQPAQLVHIERLEVQNDRATTLAFYQRSGTDAGGLECELKKNRGTWQVESCGPNPGDEELAIRVRLYKNLAGYISWLGHLRSDITALCLSEGLWTDRSDPAGAVLLRLILASGSQHYPDSTCTQDELPTASGDQRAIRLHIGQVEHDGENALASAVVQYELQVIELQCEMRRLPATWIPVGCRPEGAAPELTDDDVAVRVALIEHHAVDYPTGYQGDWTKQTWCILDNTTEDADPPAAVMSRLAGDDRDFHPRSDCTFPGPFQALLTPDAETAGEVAIHRIVRHADYAEATVNVVYPIAGYQWHCRLVNPSSTVWTVEVCARGDILN